MQGKVSVLGCGWFGFPLAQRLVKAGYKVSGSVRSVSKISALTGAGIEPYVLNLEKEVYSAQVKDFLDCETLIISIPPSSQMKSHLEQIKTFLSLAAKPPHKIIYISSTSVYVDNNGVVTEDNQKIPEKGNGAVLRQTEEYIRSNYTDCVILRFGGLIGPDRNPAKYFAGRKNIPGGKNPVNLVHLDDCVGVTKKIIEDKFIPGVYNVCSPAHPEKALFYTKSAERLGLEIPEFEDNLTSYKIVSPEHLIKTINYTFLYPSPIDMI